MPPRHEPTSDGVLWLTDEVLFHFQRCTRRAFLDLYGDHSRRDAPNDYLAKLRQDSISHQLTVMDNGPIHRPSYPRQDWAAGAEATLQLMRQGVERIAYGVLTMPYGDRVQLVTTPKLLERQPGRSNFGDWLYVPTDIKLGKRPKTDYQVIAAYHAFLLAEVQGTLPDTSWLVLRERAPHAVNLDEWLVRLEEVLENCLAMLLDRQEPEVFIARNRCDLCHWFSHCYAIAQTEKHLSLLPGVTPSRYQELERLGLTSVEALATTDPKQLEGLPGFGAIVARKMVRQAQALLYNVALPYSAEQSLDKRSELLLSPDELPTAPVELYFDIEAAPEHNLIYLHGVLVVDRQSGSETFHALLANHPDQEEAVWRDFLDLVGQYPTAPIYHFCPFEVQTVKRLAARYPVAGDWLDPLLLRFVDLHERITRVATMPVENYALKSIARWIGFNWRDADANGAQAIYWYDQWLTTGDRTFLDTIVRYNEDDCIATYRVKDWLTEFVRQVALHGRRTRKRSQHRSLGA
jgi:predicted RecB family nuclease